MRREYFYRQMKYDVEVSDKKEFFEFNTYRKKFGKWVLVTHGNGFIDKSECIAYVTDFSKIPPAYVLEKIKELTECESIYIRWA